MWHMVRVAALWLFVLLASCTTVASHPAIPTATAVPCPFSNATPAPDAAPTALQVVRPYNLVANLPAFARCVHDAARVQRLYAEIMALPQKASGPYACPNGQGVMYELTFLAGAAAVQMMTLEADGCRFLHVSDTDVRTTYDAFLQAFAATVGMTEAQLF